MKKFYFLTAILFLFFSCKKKEIIPTTQGICHDNFTTPYINLSDTFAHCLDVLDISYGSDYEYLTPKFSPENSNVIAYIEHTRGPINDELILFNFCTGIKNKLTDKKVYHFDWSSQDWILFTSTNGEIWKVKSDGKELTRIATSIFSEVIKWSSDGTKMIFEQPTGNSFEYEKKMFDSDGLLIDELEKLESETIDQFDWNENLICFGSYGKIKFYNTITEEVNVIDSFPNAVTGQIGNIHFYDKDNIYWTEYKGSYGTYIWKTNILTKETIQITSNPQHNVNSFYDISEDKQSIVSQKIGLEFLDECRLISHINLTMMNIDGTNERKILLPE